MSEENTLNNWQEVIVDFLENKKNLEELKYIKDEIKKIDKKFKNRQYFNNQELEDFFNTKKNKPKAEELAFQQKKLKDILSLDIETTALNAEEVEKVEQEYKTKYEEIKEKYTPNIWLSKNSKNAGSVSFATHIPKLTHSKIDSPSFYDDINSKNNSQLTTSSLKNKAEDGAVAGNQFAPICQFLELNLKGEKIKSEFKNINNTILKVFSPDDEGFKKWNIDFNKALVASKVSAHSLLKQIYFPIDDNNYHLLCNIKSSSIAHTIFKRILRPDEKSAKKLRDKNKYSNISINSFPRKSTLSTTRSNHSNASQLNGKRGGKINLFSSQPPTWQYKLKQPFKESMFDGYYHPSSTSSNIKYLVEFLLRNENIDLSIRDPEKQQWLKKWTACIVDDFLFFVGNINNLPSGWSSTKDSKLKTEHGYLLDPNREDVEFQTNRKNTDWQTVVVDDFSTWLNKQLKNSDKRFTPQKEYSRTWKAVMKKELREYNQIIEAGI